MREMIRGALALLWFVGCSGAETTTVRFDVTELVEAGQAAGFPIVRAEMRVAGPGITTPIVVPIDLDEGFDQEFPAGPKRVFAVVAYSTGDGATGELLTYYGARVVDLAARDTIDLIIGVYPAGIASGKVRVADASALPTPFFVNFLPQNPREEFAGPFPARVKEGGTYRVPLVTDTYDVHAFFERSGTAYGLLALRQVTVRQGDVVENVDLFLAPEGFCNPSSPTDSDGDGDSCLVDCDDGNPELNFADADGDGVSTCEGDCDDDPLGCGINCNPNIVVDACDGGLDNDCDASTSESGSNWYRDADNDTFGDPNNSVVACTPPAGYVANNTDCDDTNAARFPGNAEIYGNGVDEDCSGSDNASCFVDADGDGYGSTTVLISTDADCTDPGESATSTDCDDLVAAVNPGVAESIANGVDDDCDGFEDCYQDGDLDTYGSAVVVQSLVLGCVGTGVAPNSGDCNDANMLVNPSQSEVTANSEDDDCDGFEACYQDLDGDTYGTATTVVSADLDCVDAGESSVSTDCDDSCAACYPHIVLDNDCDGLDQDCQNGPDDIVPTYYADNDMDGYGDPATGVQTCSPNPGDVLDGTDCNDNINTIYPGATEIVGNQVDENCDGNEECYQDADMDGYGTRTTGMAAGTSCTGMWATNAIDCDDGDASANWDDADGDGEPSCLGDCNDSDPYIHTGRAEQCDGMGIDENCDGRIDSADYDCFCADLDGDTFGCGDCDDFDPTRNHDDRDNDGVDNCGDPSCGSQGGSDIHLRTHTGSSWDEVAGSANGAGVSNPGFSDFSDIGIDAGNPVVVWQQDDAGMYDIMLRRYDGANWIELMGSASAGGISQSSGMSSEPAVAVAATTDIWVSWVDNFNVGVFEVYVKRYNGSSWSGAGGSDTGGGISADGVFDSSHPDIVVRSSNNRPIVAWEKLNATASDIHVLEFNGASWGNLGGNSNVSNSPNDASKSPSLVLDGDFPYLAYTQDVSGLGEIYVTYYNGGSWIEVGTGSASGGGVSNTPSGMSSHPAIAVRATQPVIAWEEQSGSQPEIHVLEFNGTSWAALGGAENISNTPGDGSFSPAIAVDGNDLYVAWEEASFGQSNVYVRRYNGGTMNWEEVSNSASGGGVSNQPDPSLDVAIAMWGAQPTVVWTQTFGGCGQPQDCDDSNRDISPLLPERCDGGSIDRDCDGDPASSDTDCAACVDDDGDLYCANVDCDDSASTGADFNYDDVDRDGLFSCPWNMQPADCNDNYFLAPLPLEHCFDNIDNDCDGLVDQEDTADCNPGCSLDTDQDGFVCGDCDDTAQTGFLCAFDCRTLYEDTDNDGFGNSAVTRNTCLQTGWVEQRMEPRHTPFATVPINNMGYDCDDTDSTYHPLAMEICGNGLDEDCSGVPDDQDYDYDGDFAPSCGGNDCDDTNVLLTSLDYDNDGYSTCSSPDPDCDDDDPTTYPFAPELCDGRDNDCDPSGAIDDIYTADVSDTDQDGVWDCKDNCIGEVNALAAPLAIDFYVAAVAPAAAAEYDFYVNGSQVGTRTVPTASACDSGVSDFLAFSATAFSWNTVVPVVNDVGFQRIVTPGVNEDELLYVRAYVDFGGGNFTDVCIWSRDDVGCQPPGPQSCPGALCNECPSSMVAAPITGGPQPDADFDGQGDACDCDQLGGTLWCVGCSDQDGDGFVTGCTPTPEPAYVNDCDDSIANGINVNPANFPEDNFNVCTDGLDNDCNGLTDGGEPFCAGLTCLVPQSLGTVSVMGVAPRMAHVEIDTLRLTGSTGTGNACNALAVEQAHYATLSVEDPYGLATGVDFCAFSLTGPETLEISTHDGTTSCVETTTPSTCLATLTSASPCFTDSAVGGSVYNLALRPKGGATFVQLDITLLDGF